MRVDKIEDDVLIARGEVYDSSALVLLAGREALLVEALGSRPDAESLRAFVVGELGRTVRFIVATHYFSDHMAGLALFPEADIVAHRLHRHTFDTELHRTDEERAFFVAPTLVVSESLVLRFGRFSLDIFWNPGQTMGCLAVDVPEADLLHASDTLVGNIAYLCYSSPALLIAALERLKQRGRRRVLASHGGVVTPGAFESALHYTSSLEARVRQARKQDDPPAIEAIPLAACLPLGVTPTAFEDIFHRRNLASVAERHLFES